ASTRRLALARIEHIRAQIDAGPAQAVGELGPNSGGAVVTHDLAVLVDALLLEDEDVLGGHYVLFHSDDLGEPENFPASVAEPGEVDHHVGRRREMVAHRAHRE